MKATMTEESRVHLAVYKTPILMIQEVVAEHFGLTIAQIQSHARQRDIVFPRQIVHYFCTQRIEHVTLSTIGYWTGNGKAFDHVSVAHSVKIIKEMITLCNKGKYVYPEVRSEIERIAGKLNAKMWRNKTGEDMESFARHNGDFLN